ncbi:hypothetical protein DICPUDRAFT_94519 [Dictyostelium purpureum]|uniref:peptidylprolyl isomerase n=1 Tax=Dictyostelium purpureum TaxID=5786 RepID=F0ZKH7_DICPU|nr:uncharacterized protein DICPUDRAFT_94519 [Dictyostelium purpureum]EGC35544.1 hypothetical protein DICPUDRAFT_94519 [Dictyostelium purpureum]|eukprot:XP_003287915.1 hypothetical protein DICPUDRAFT_94519 [Dictyostelium purpureum]
MMGVISNFIKQGAATGKQAIKGNKVTVHYTGKLNDKNGKKFDSSKDRGTPFSFVLGKNQVIRGWDEGVLNKKEGDIFELTITPDYGYGSRGIGPIPGNSTLYFEVELLKVEQ